MTMSNDARESGNESYCSSSSNPGNSQNYNIANNISNNDGIISNASASSSGSSSAIASTSGGSGSNSKRPRQNRSEVGLLKRSRRSLSGRSITSSSGCSSGHNHELSSLTSKSSSSSTSTSSSSSTNCDHSRCVYIAGAFQSVDLYNCYRRFYARQYNNGTSAGSMALPLTPSSTNANSVLCNSCIPPMIAFNRAHTINEPIMSLANSDKFNRANCNKCLYKNPDTLLELASKAVASSVSFETVEQHSSRIPIPVQERIIFWSFPRDDSFLRLYSSISAILGRNKYSINVENELRSLSVNATNSGTITGESQHHHQQHHHQTSSSLPLLSRSNSSRHIFPNSQLSVHNISTRNDNGFGRSHIPSGLSPESKHELEQQRFWSIFKAGDIILAKGTVKNVIQIGKFCLSSMFSSTYPRQKNVINKLVLREIFAFKNCCFG